jgi:hypothetical protein
MKKSTNTSTLPADVYEAIENASIMIRSGDRVIINLAGHGFQAAWYFEGREELIKKVKKLFPELAEMQIERAVAFITSKIVAYTKQLNRKDSSNWVFKYRT